MRGIALALVAGLLASCAARTADPNLDAEAKAFRPSGGKACIYVIPSSSSYTITVNLDGRKIGSLANENYFRLDVPPGRHVLYVTPNTMIPVFSRNTNDDVALEAEAERCYFLRAAWTEFDRNWRYPRVYLERIAAEQGQQAVNVRTLIPSAQ